MTKTSTDFSVRLASSDADLRAAQALRYQVFVKELGGDGDLVDHDAGLERDRFDPYFDHLLLTDTGSGEVVGVYRLLTSARAEKAGQFYSEGEYDLAPLRSSGRNLLELGRSCLHPDYRGGAGMYHLWNALAQYVAEHRIEVLFGVASFPGTDISALSSSLTLLHHNHLAPQDLRVRATEYQPMDLEDPSKIDRRKAMLGIPALIKAYLRLGGFVGDGAFVDHRFNTTDVCLILDTERMNARQKRIYAGNGET